MIRQILLIDDDEITNFVNKKIIESFVGDGENVKTLLSAKEALSYLKTCSTESVKMPELILLDLNMPEMSGWEFLDEFKKRFKSEELTTKIFLLSSSQNPEDIEQSKKYECVSGFMGKPFNKDKLAVVWEQIS